MKIIVILNFARSGGTLLTRLLNTFPDAWVFSEINPRAGAMPDHMPAEPTLAVARQAAEWFGLHLRPSEGLLGTIQDLSELAESHGKTLVIRDWSYQNFRKTKQNDFDPSYRFELLDELRKGLIVTPVAFVRDGIDVFLSMGQGIAQFGNDYLLYVRRIIDERVPVLKYEDLVSRPHDFEAEITALTGVSWKIDFHAYESSPATGDLQIGKVSRGIRAGKVKCLPRKRVSHSLIREIERNAPLLDANRLMGYPETYWNGNVESVAGMIARYGLNAIYRLV